MIMVHAASSGWGDYMEDKMQAFDPVTGGTMEVHMPSFDGIDRHAASVEKILHSLWEVSGISGAIVSDLSSLHDFMLDEAEIARMAQMLGVDIDPDGECLLVDIAKSMAEG